MARGGLLLFTYGSLQPGQPAAWQLGPLRRVEAACLRMHRLFDTGLDFAAAVPVRTPSTVRGMLVELDDDSPQRLAGLDRAAGFDPEDRPGSLFVRARTMVPVGGRGARLAWVYVSHPDRLSRLRPGVRLLPLPGGDWLAHRRGGTLGGAANQVA